MACNSADISEKRQTMIIPVILAGGSGTRLWPLSRRLFPKQLLNLTQDKSLLQQTILRVVGASGVTDPIIICNDAYRYMTAEQLREIGVKTVSMVLEPVGRNTAPAVGVAALMAKGMDPEAMILVLPSDHLIPDVEKFHRTLDAASCFAAHGNLVTFGVVPGSPETGYGYIRKGKSIACGSQPLHEAFKIHEFVEKPDLQTAGRYVRSGEYCWNSGMFMFRAKDIIREMELLAPEIMEACKTSVEKGISENGVLMLDPDAFHRCPSDSIDYAIMEKTRRGVMVPFDAGWNDVGSWEALWDLGMKNGDNNLIRGDVISHESKGCLVFAESRLVTVLGMKDAIVVETSDAVLVAERGCCQGVRHIVDELQVQGREESIRRGRTLFQWGSVALKTRDEKMVVRQVTLTGKSSVRADIPKNRVLHWVIADGEGTIIKPGETIAVSKDVAIHMDPETVVVVENPKDRPLVFMECYLPGGTDEEHFNH
jgi:mannose-1-phosphate guanylyltransferase/mannose-6-phosphate isomerase